MSDRPNRNEQRRARTLAAQQAISYQQALTRVRDDASAAAAPASQSMLGGLAPGEVRTVIVAWRLDDPVVQDDGRFWVRVPEQAATALGKPAGTIMPKGQTLGFYRARAAGHEYAITNPVSGEAESVSLERWSDADPERTHVIISFDHAFTDPRRAGAGALRRGDVTSVKLELSAEAQRIRDAQAELQRAFRAARAAGDERRMRELSAVLDDKAAELARAAWPDYHRGWDLSRAIREGTNRYVLDWTTGY